MAYTYETASKTASLAHSIRPGSSMTHTDKMPLISRTESTEFTRGSWSSKSGVDSYYYTSKSPPPASMTQQSYYRAPPPPPPFPPPPHYHQLNRNPAASMNALQSFQPLPNGEQFEARYYMNDRDTVMTPPDTATRWPTPSSPRVEDRYEPRMAPLAATRSRRETRRRYEWPGWVSDQEAPVRQRPAAASMALRGSSSPSPSPSPWGEYWASPSSGGRKTWGWVLAVVVLLMIVATVLATFVTEHKALSARLQQAADMQPSPGAAVVSAGGVSRRRLGRRFSG